MKTYLDLKAISQFCKENGWGYSADGQPQAFTEDQFKKVAELCGWVESNPAYRALFNSLARWICARLKPRRSLELGCGPGYLVHCLADMGVEAVGFDGNKSFWQEFQLLHYGKRHRYILDPYFEAPVEQADVFISIEVFEHIPDDSLDRIMSRIRDEILPQFIVFSSTPYKSEDPNWDLQWGHINLKQPDEWARFFAEYGFKLQTTKPPVTEWAQLYAHTPRD